MARDRFIRCISAAALLAAAAALSGCGTAPRPFSFEEKLWFYKASHPERIIDYPGHPDFPHRHRARRGYVVDDAPPFVPPPVGYRG